MLNIDGVSIKIKKGYLVLKAGMVIEEPVAKIPLNLVPKIDWDPSMKKLIINELIRKEELKTVLQMSGYKEKDSEEKKGSTWSEDK